MTTVTLIGEALAEPGQTFVFEGAAPGCDGCPYRDQCLNLENGKRYRISDVRSGAQRLPCAVHEDDVVAVEVEPVAIDANVPANQAMAGNQVSLVGPCPYVECPSHTLCMPPGVSFDDAYRVESIDGDPPHETCHLDRSLTQVTVSGPR